MDSNPNIGSGGFNPSRSPTGFKSQLFVNRQTTGLSSFQGSVPYFPANELRLDLPSDQLTGFRRRSVGVGQAVQGETYLTSPFFSRSRTVLGPREIKRGLASPGTNAPKTAFPSVSSIGKLSYDYKPAFKPIVPFEAGRALATTSTPGLIPLTPLVELPSETEGIKLPRPVVSPEQLAEQQRLARELLELKPEEKEQPIGDVRIDKEIKHPVDMLKLEQPADANNPIRKPQPSELTPKAPNRQPAVQPVPEEPLLLPTAPPALQLDQFDRDVYTDLLRLLRRQQQIEMRTTGKPQPPGKFESDANTAQPAPVKFVEIIPRTNTVVVHSLAGKNRDKFNDRMARAEKYLKAGKFLDAADEYEYAAMLSRSNPLPHVGLGLARFASSLSFSGVLSIQKAFRLQPALIKTWFDLPSMMPQEAIDLSIAALEKRLARGELDSRLLFLIAFIHHNQRQHSKAKTAAKRLGKLAGDNKFFKKYAEFILVDGKHTQMPARKLTPSIK